MSYQVLARKYRPQSFEQVVGQEAAVLVLANSLKRQQFHHACLLTGTRGVGKTTLGRIIAKGLNCINGVTESPCNQCDHCIEISQGRFVDLIEVDAASRTKVEDTREILENVQYRPTKGRYKVYLIDEVHMLSKHSFNSLLKTLEEPPEYVKFILATTDPEQIPVTILSRCLQISLKHLSPELIAEHMAELLGELKIDFEQPVVDKLGFLANGSMRDGLSILDRVIAYNDQSKLMMESIHQLLGVSRHEQLVSLLLAVTENNVDHIIETIRQIAETSIDYHVMLADLIELLHQVNVFQLVESARTVLPNHDSLEKLSKSMSAELVQLCYQIALKGREDLKLSPSLRSGFEMIMLRMAMFQIATPDLVQVSEKIKPVKTSLNSAANDNNVQSGQQAAEQIELTSNEVWVGAISKLALSGITLALAKCCTFHSIHNSLLTLRVDPKQKLLIDSRRVEQIQVAINQYYNRSYKLEIVIEETDELNRVETEVRQSKQAIDSDNVLQSLMSSFDAKIIDSSIKQNDD